MSNIDDYKNLWSELWSVFRYDVIRSKPDYMELFKIKYEHAVSLLKRDPRPDLSTRNILICNIDPQISSGGNITAAHSMYSLFERIERGPRGQKLPASVFKTDWVTIATALCYNPNVTDSIPLDINAVFKHLCDGQSNGVPEKIHMDADEAFGFLRETWQRGFNSTVANIMFKYEDGVLIPESKIPPVRFSDGQTRSIRSPIPPFMSGNSMGWDIAILLLLGLVVVKVEDENSIGYANVGSVSIGTLANLHKKTEYKTLFEW